MTTAATEQSTDAAEAAADDGPESLHDRHAILQAIEDNEPDLITPAGYVHLRHPEAIVQAVDVQTMSATFTIVTRNENERNRHGNRVQIVEGPNGKGLRTDLGYEQNPVVLYDHGFSELGIPVALSRDRHGLFTVKKTAKKATATAYFRPLPHSEAIFAAVAEDLLRMASIGYDPLRAMLVKEQRDEQMPEGVERLGVDNCRGLDFTETELLEWSITPIGADRGALKQALHRGKIHDVRLPGFLRRSFELHAGPKRAWSPGVDFCRQTIEPWGVTLEGAPEAVQQAMARLNASTEPQAAQAPSNCTPVDQTPPTGTIPPQVRRVTMADLATCVKSPRAAGASAVPISALARVIDQRIRQLVEPIAAESCSVIREFERRSGKIGEGLQGR